MPNSMRSDPIERARRRREQKALSRVVALVSLVALLVPTAVATLAQPAGAAQGGILTVVGTGVNSYNGDGIPAPSAEIEQVNPTFDGHGNLLIVGGAALRLVAESPTNPGYTLTGCAHVCTWIVGDIYDVAGVADSLDSSYNGDGISATTARIGGRGLAVDADGNPLISDGTRVRIVAMSATNPGYALSSTCGSGTDPCTWTHDDMYTIAGDGTPGYSGDGGPAALAGFVEAAQIAIDGQGNPLLVDSLRLRVVAVSASNPGYTLTGCAGTCSWTVGDIYTIAGDGTEPSSSIDGLPASTALHATDVTVDAAGNPLVTEFSGLVQVLALSASNPGYGLAADCGDGTDGCTWTDGDTFTVAGGSLGGGDGGPAIGADLVASGVALDHTGNLIVDDGTDARVRVVAMSALNPGYQLAGCSGTCTWTVGDIYTIAGNGISGFSGDGGPATSAEVVEPGMVTVDSLGNVYFDDRDRVREIFVAITAPSAPKSVTAVAGSTNATVHWIAPPINGGPTATGYVVTPYLNGITAQPARTFNTTATTDVVSGLTNTKAYTFKVAAKNAIGTGPQSSTASVAIVIGAPKAPIGVKAATNSATMTTGSLSVTYTAGANNGAAITKFTATCVSTNGGVTKTGVHTGATAAAITVTGVSTGKGYACTVKATNARGLGAASVASVAIAVGAPSPPTAVHAVKVAAGQLKVTFVPGANNGNATSEYLVGCSSSNGGAGGGTFGPAGPFTITGLTAGKSYTCTVTGFNQRGFGVASSPSPAVTA